MDGDAAAEHGFRLVSVSFGRDGRVVSVTAAASPGTYGIIARILRYPSRIPDRNGEVVTTFPVAVMLTLHGQCGPYDPQPALRPSLSLIRDQLDRVVTGLMPEYPR
jgi:hypothetical protein